MSKKVNFALGKTFIKNYWAGYSGSSLLSQGFGRTRWAEHLRSGVRDQRDQHGENLSLLKTQGLARYGVSGACNPCYSGG